MEKRFGNVEDYLKVPFFVLTRAKEKNTVEKEKKIKILFWKERKHSLLEKGEEKK